MPDMVAVTAIVRREMLERVVHRLKEAGVPRLTVGRVHAIGAGVDPASARLSLDEVTESADKAQVEFICGREREEMLTEILARAAHTGRRGDGIMYTQPVRRITNIRNGTTGLQALE